MGIAKNNKRLKYLSRLDCIILFENYFALFAGCTGAVVGTCVLVVAVSVFAGDFIGVDIIEGFAVSTTLKKIKATMIPPKVQVAFSIKSLVL